MKHKNNKPLLRSSRMKAIGRERNFGSIRKIIRENIELKDDKIIRHQIINYIFNKTFSNVNIIDSDKKIILDFVDTMTTTTLEGRELLGFLSELELIVSDFIKELNNFIKELKKEIDLITPESFQQTQEEYLKQIKIKIDIFYLNFFKKYINYISNTIISDNSQKLIDDLIRNKYDEKYLKFINSVVADKINFLLFANIVIQVSFNIQYLDQYLNI